MNKEITQRQERNVTPVARLKNVLANDSVQEQFRNALADNASLFTASLIDLYASDTYLQNCDPQLVVMEALKAATLKLPINKSLGFAYIVPYKKKGKQIPQFQIGYKGMIQLAMRTGQYRFINAGYVYEGEFIGENRLTGEVNLSGEKISDEVVGYFAYIQTINGFTKTAYMSVSDMEQHGRKYSKAYSNKYAPWQTEPHKMGRKTMLRQLLGTYGIMSVEMSAAFESESLVDEEVVQDEQFDIIDIEEEQAVSSTEPEIQPEF
jgi:recombination protein RecT